MFTNAMFANSLNKLHTSLKRQATISPRSRCLSENAQPELCVNMTQLDIAAITDARDSLTRGLITMHDLIPSKYFWICDI